MAWGPTESSTRRRWPNWADDWQFAGKSRAGLHLQIEAPERKLPGFVDDIWQAVIQNPEKLSAAVTPHLGRRLGSRQAALPTSNPRSVLNFRV